MAWPAKLYAVRTFPHLPQRGQCTRPRAAGVPFRDRPLHNPRTLAHIPFAWDLIGVTTKSRFNADSLTPGTCYWFDVTAIGAAGETSKSDVLRAMAAA